MKLRKSWETRLTEAKARGSFTHDDKEKISTFETCFIGEHYPKLGDKRLSAVENELGYRASLAVLMDDVETAIEIYDAVQMLYD